MAADTGWSCLRHCSQEVLTSPSGCSLVWVTWSYPCNAAVHPEKEKHRTCSLSTCCQWQREQANNIIPVIPKVSFCWIAPLGGSPPISLSTNFNIMVFLQVLFMFLQPPLQLPLFLGVLLWAMGIFLGLWYELSSTEALTILQEWFQLISWLNKLWV